MPESSDPAKRQKLADEIQTRAYELVFYLPTGQFQNVSAVRNNISGVIIAPVMLLYNIEKK